MAIQLYVPGPAYIFVGTGSSGAMEFLGVCDGGVGLRDDPVYEDVPTDLGGPGMPTDMSYMGIRSMADGTLSKFDEAILAKITPHQIHPTIVANGLGATGTIGQLAILESLSLRVTIVAAYKDKAVFSGMTPARNYPRGLFRSGLGQNWSVRTKRVQFGVYGIPLVGYDGAFGVFDADITGITLPTNP